MINGKTSAQWSFTVPDLARTLSLGRAIGETVRSPGVIAFHGGLGSGKTTVIQAIGRGLGHNGAITSPTYTIINSYAGGRMELVHVDCYRIEEEDELYETGLAEIIGEGRGLVCIEWAGKALGLLPRARLDVSLENRGRERRELGLTLSGGLWPELHQTINSWIERELI